MLGKINTFHSSSDDDTTTIDQDKIPNATIECKNNIDMIKQESKLSIDGIDEEIPKALETKENEAVDEVCEYFYLFFCLII